MVAICQIEFSPVFIQAQSYHKLIRTNTYWDNYIIESPVWCYASIHRIYFTGTDTTIGGVSYNKSRQYDFESIYQPGPLCPPFIIDNVSNSTGVFIREDTVTRKVYVYDEFENQHDQLFYDFSLEIGDTLHSLINGNNLFVVSSIENVTLQNGEVRKMFVFNNNDHEYYIESLGGSQGIFYTIMWDFTVNGGYFCISENGTNLWGFNCDYYFVGNNQINTNDILSISPNPATSYLDLRLNKTIHNIKFVLMDLSGQLIISRQISEQDTKIMLNGISPGLYLGHLLFDEGDVKSRIIIQ
jgi:hypothetical protein